MNIIKNNWAFSILIFVFVAVIGFSNIGVDEVEAGAPADPPTNDNCKCVNYNEESVVMGDVYSHNKRKKSEYDKRKTAYDNYQKCIHGEKEKYGRRLKNFFGYGRHYYVCDPKAKVWIKKEWSAWRNDCVKPGPKMKPLIDEEKKLEAKSSWTDKEKKRATEIKKEIENGIKNGNMHCDKWSGTCLSCGEETIGGGEDPFPFILITGPLKKLSKATGS